MNCQEGCTEVVTDIAGVVKLDHGNAEGVKEGMLKGLEAVGLTARDLRNKLVGINTDGAAVNLGRKGGAVKLLMDRINEEFEDDSNCNNYMTVVHCVAHNLELAVCDAKKEVGYMKTFESILKGIFQLYYYSPKRRRELYEIASALDQELKHYGGVQQIRWVASQNRALKALFDDYDVTVVHLQDVISTGRDENAMKARGYLAEMKSKRFLTYLHFMLDWTNLLSEISVLFQQKKCLISEVAKRVKELKESMIAMKTRRGKILRKFIRETADGNFHGNEMTEIRGRGPGYNINQQMDGLLTDSAFFLEERFIKHLGGEPHALFNVFDYFQWPKQDTEPDMFRVYGDEEIEKLVQLYAPVLTEEERESAPDEWLQLKMRVGRNLNRPVVDTYESVLSENAEHIQHILPLVRIMLTVSPTTAECERGFSHLNQIKTQLRMSLNQETLSALLKIKVDGPSTASFDPTECVVRWLHSGRGTRHIRGHVCRGVRQRRDSSSESSQSDSQCD